MGLCQFKRTSWCFGVIVSEAYSSSTNELPSEWLDQISAKSIKIPRGVDSHQMLNIQEWVHLLNAVFLPPNKSLD